MKIKTSADMAKWIVSTKETIEKYGFQNKRVHPWGNLSMTATEIVDSCADYPRCTLYTQLYLRGLAEGFDEILEAWVQYAEAPKVNLRLKSGKVVNVPEDDVCMFEGQIEEVF